MTLSTRARRSLISLAAAALAGWFALVDAPPGLVREARGAGALSADEMRAAIERGIPELLRPPFRQRGEIRVSERGGVFDIVVPGVEMAGDDGGTLDVGDVAITAVAQSDGDYRVEVSVPATMTLRDAGGAATGTVTVGGQRFAGVWSPRFEALLHVDAAYQDIRAGGSPALRIGALSMKGATVETAPGVWKSPSMIRLDDVEITAAEGGGRFTVAAVEMRSDVEDMRLDEQLRFTRAISEALQSGLEEGDGSQPDPLVLLCSVDATPALFGDFTMDVTLAGIAYRDETGAAVFDLDRQTYRLTMNSLDGDRSTIGFGYEHDGLDVAMIEDAPTDVIPGHVVLDIAATRLPNGALWQACRDWARTMATSPPEVAGALLTDRLRAAVFAAATQIEIRRLEISAPRFSVEAQGALRADPAALYNVTAELDVAIHGLDRLVQSMSVMSENDAEAAKAAGVLALLQALGALEHDETGAPYRRYRVAVSADGKVTLNGADLAPLLRALEMR